MPNFLSEEPIEQAMVQRSPPGHGNITAKRELDGLIRDGLIRDVVNS